MGACSHKIAKEDSLSNRPVSRSSVGEDEGLWEDVVQTSECCGCVRTKITRKKVTWEDRFIRNCAKIVKEYSWAEDLIELVKTSTLSKRNYVAEINELKKMAYSQNLNIEEVRSVQELQKFKAKLKQSMVVTLQGSIKQTDGEGSHLKQEHSFSRSKRASRFEASRYKNSMASNHLEAKLRKQVMPKVEDSLSDIMGERSVTRSTTNELQVFIRFTNMLTKHLSDVFCLLGTIQRFFIQHIDKKYKGENQNRGDCSRVEVMIGDITQYLELLKETIIDFYNLTVFREEQCQNSFINNEENILSACTNILFSDSRLYSAVFQTISQFCRDKDKKLNQITAKLVKKGPEQFMVKEKFCLNLRTLQSQCKAIKREEEDTQISKNEETSEPPLAFAPYSKCVQQIRKISAIREPINKMKTLISCAELIPLSIEQFYVQHDLSKDQWLLDADQVLSIFCYILAQARIPNLNAHLFLLQNFATSHQVITVAGYYMSVVSCGVEQLMKGDESGLDDFSF